MISARTVVERRQRLGMLRAIGYQPEAIRLTFAAVYVAALLTTYLPARRASRIYPAEALGYQ